MKKNPFVILLCPRAMAVVSLSASARSTQLLEKGWRFTREDNSEFQFRLTTTGCGRL